MIPAKNEAGGLENLLPKLARTPYLEVLVIDDGSTDHTGDVASKYGARVIRHPYSKGNGAAIKTGASSARGSIVVFMDADGQHNPDDVARLIDRLQTGYDMVIGSREHGSTANFSRSAANRFYNLVATYMTGQRIKDLTSGFRVVKKRPFLAFLHLLPNGFSYPTTITMAFFRAGLLGWIRANSRHQKAWKESSKAAS